MNGATVGFWESAIKPARRIKKSARGTNHHFFRALMYSQNSATIASLLNATLLQEDTANPRRDELISRL